MSTLAFQAIKDNNKIWATLRVGTNQDGRTATPITSPSGQQQTDLLKHVYGQYGIDKASVQVIEAHGILFYYLRHNLDVSKTRN